MSIAGVSSSSASLAYSSMRLHSPGCTCSLCSPQPVESTRSVQVSANGRSQEGAEAGQLSEEELAQVRQLQARDRAVRQHEQAHMSAAAGLATSGPSYTYQRGPDGVNYAIGGEVSIDVSPGRTPEETLEKAKTIERAALAPKDPSGADRAVAAQARNMAQEAQQEIAVQGEQADAAAASTPGSTRAEDATTAQERAPTARSAQERIAERYTQDRYFSRDLALISTYA